MRKTAYFAAVVLYLSCSLNGLGQSISGVVNSYYEVDGMKSAQIAGQRSIENFLEGIEHTFDDITDPSIMHGINEYMKSHSSELLVMVEHKQSFLDRIFSKDHTTAMAYQTKTPLLILEDKS